jgi:hypothetical protein
MKVAARIALILIVFWVTPASAQSLGAAGLVKVTSGSAVVVRDGVERPAKIGFPVFASDHLKTGADGLLGLTLKDDTRVSLGPNSELRLDHFEFAPADGRFGLVLKFVRGVAAYVSGRIAKLSPDSVRLETPAAIVGVRGTTLGIRVTD